MRGWRGSCSVPRSVPAPQVPLPQELQGQQISGRRNKGISRVGKSQKDKQVGVGHNNVPAQPQQPPSSLALGSSHAPVKLGDNPSDELACPGHRILPGSQTGDKQPALCPPRRAASGILGTPAPRLVLQSLELPSKVPLKINLHSHGSSGLIFPPFAPLEELRGCHPCRSGAMSHSRRDRGCPVANA